MRQEKRSTVKVFSSCCPGIRCRARPLLPGATNILTPASGFHPRIIFPSPFPFPPFLIHIYIYIYTPAFPYGFNTEEHLSLSCTLHSSSVAQLNRPARVRLLARCVTPLALPSPLFPFLPADSLSLASDLLPPRISRVRLARGSSNGPWRGRVWGNAVRIPARMEARSSSAIITDSKVHYDAFKDLHGVEEGRGDYRWRRWRKNDGTYIESNPSSHPPSPGS